MKIRLKTSLCKAFGVVRVAVACAPSTVHSAEGFLPELHDRNRSEKWTGFPAGEPNNAAFQRRQPGSLMLQKPPVFSRRKKDRASLLVVFFSLLAQRRGDKAYPDIAPGNDQDGTKKISRLWLSVNMPF